MNPRTALLGALAVVLAFGSAFAFATAGAEPRLAQAKGPEVIAVHRDLAAIPFLAPHGPPPQLAKRRSHHPRPHHRAARLLRRSRHTAASRRRARSHAAALPGAVRQDAAGAPAELTVAGPRRPRRARRARAGPGHARAHAGRPAPEPDPGDQTDEN